MDVLIHSGSFGNNFDVREVLKAGKSYNKGRRRFRESITEVNGAISILISEAVNLFSGCVNSGDAEISGDVKEIDKLFRMRFVGNKGTLIDFAT